ncbi:hypothetical protein ACIBKZ_15565 [Streptomyces sp. NPDC050421]|uniref:hypothetical protein n=1 Tax=Streptomyces sp. NPDC050421 TaxID=3365613 RepID=UPI0037B0B386
MAIIFEAKAALFERLRALIPAGTQVTFAQTGKQDRRQQIWLGDTADDELEPIAMRAGPRKPTAVSGTLDVHALVTSPGSPIDAERAVHALREHISEACRSIDLRAIPGLIDVRPTSANVETGESTDGAYSVLDVSVRIRGRVT